MFRGSLKELTSSVHWRACDKRSSREYLTSFYEYHDFLKQWSRKSLHPLDAWKIFITIFTVSFTTRMKNLYYFLFTTRMKNLYRNINFFFYDTSNKLFRARKVHVGNHVAIIVHLEIAQTIIYLYLNVRDAIVCKSMRSSLSVKFYKYAHVQFLNYEIQLIDRSRKNEKEIQNDDKWTMRPSNFNELRERNRRSFDCSNGHETIYFKRRSNPDSRIHSRVINES